MAMEAAVRLDNEFELEAVARAQAAAGDFEAALATAGKIENVAFRIRTSPLATIAIAQAAGGDLRGATATAQKIATDFFRAARVGSCGRGIDP
jgi:hypothetical protein